MRAASPKRISPRAASPKRPSGPASKLPVPTRNSSRRSSKTDPSPRPSQRDVELDPSLERVRVIVRLRPGLSDSEIGAMLSHEISKRYGGEGLPDGTISIKLDGHTGQSFGFTLAKGVALHVSGDANDGAPPSRARFAPSRRLTLSPIARASSRYSTGLTAWARGKGRLILGLKRL